MNAVAVACAGYVRIVALYHKRKGGLHVIIHSWYSWDYQHAMCHMNGIYKHIVTGSADLIAPYRRAALVQDLNI